MTTIAHIREQLTWIADHDYREYDSPISQSRGSVAVYKADIERLIDLVEQVFPTDAALDGLDPDQMQIDLEAEVDDFINLNILQSLVEIKIIDEIRHRITRVRPLSGSQWTNAFGNPEPLGDEFS
jgi:hypothetical protein